MTAKDLIQSVDEGDAHRFTSMSEGYVYLYLRFHADKRGVFRLAMTELASMLNVNRQTVLKHVETLIQKRLVTREGHGRYHVHAEPFSLRDAAKAYRATLKPGDEWWTYEFAKIAYGIEFDAESTDPRLDEAMAYTQTLEQAGRLIWNEFTATYTVPQE